MSECVQGLKKYISCARYCAPPSLVTESNVLVCLKMLLMML